jgi:hypothetical protein
MTFSILYRGVVYANESLGDGASRSDAINYATYIDPTRQEAKVREHRDSDGKILDQYRVVDA